MVHITYTYNYFNYNNLHCFSASTWTSELLYDSTLLLLVMLLLIV